MNPEEELIDVTRLNDLRDLFRADFGDTLRSFVANAQLYAREIDDAVTRGDAADVEHHAHKLKSSTAMFGARHVSAISIEIEEMARRGDMGRLQVLCRELGPALDLATALLRAHIRELGDEAR